MEKVRHCSTPTLDYGAHLPVQSVVEECQYIEYPCLTNGGLDTNVPLDFRLDRTNTAMDMSNIYLSFSVQVFKGDSSVLPDDAIISTVNNFGYSLFSGVEVFLQDQKISSSQGYYQYCSYLKMLLFTTDHEKQFYLRQALWRRDTPAQFDNFNTDQEKGFNQGFIDRSSYIAKSAKSHFLIKLIFDFTLTQLIPEQTEVFIRLHRAKPSSCLLAKDGEYKIKIADSCLYVPRYRLSKSGETIITSRLARGLDFISRRYNVYTKMVGKGDQNTDWNVLSGTLPQRMFFFQILNSAYNGNIDKNIYNFQTFGMKKLNVSKNGQTVPISHGIDVPDSKEPQVLYAMTLMALNRPECVSFTTFDFANGYMVACFDLSKGNCTGTTAYRSLPESGNLRIQVDYSKPLDEAITLFCITEDFATLRLDKQKNPDWI